MTDFDPTSPRQAGERLQRHGLRPQKRLGQNFLCDQNTIDRIVRAACLAPDDRTVEIGGGLGALTIALSAVAASVTVVEIDRHFEPILQEIASTRPNVTPIFADFLRLDLDALFGAAFGDRAGVVVANIPYYITSPIIEALIAHKARVKRVVLLVQNEVARRIAAAPGSDECGSMSLYVQYHADVELIGTVPRTVFLPVPDVDSAIIALTPLADGKVMVRNEERLFHIIRAGFGQRRKTLLNALLRAPASFDLGFTMESRAEAEALLARAGIDPSRRGETLSLEEYARISDSFDIE